MLSTAIPTEISDPVNARILSVSEDRLAGFVEQPFRDIETLADVPEDVVHEQLAAMLAAGRSEIKPSEVSPVEYERWCVRTGVDPETMRAGSD